MIRRDQWRIQTRCLRGQSKKGAPKILHLFKMPSFSVTIVGCITQKRVPFLGQEMVIFVRRTVQSFRESPQFKIAFHHQFTKSLKQVQTDRSYFSQATLNWERYGCPKQSFICTISGARRKFPRGTKFRHNRVTSQINFRGSVEGTTILGVRGHSPGKILQNYTKNTHFCAFWKQALDNTDFTFFYF